MLFNKNTEKKMLSDILTAVVVMLLLGIATYDTLKHGKRN